MSERQPNIPDITLETLGRTFYKEAARYGFQQLDYVRFVNLLLDLATHSDDGLVPERPASIRSDSVGSGARTVNGSGLPLHGSRVDIRAFDPVLDLDLLEGWVQDAHGKYFLLSRPIARRLELNDVTDGRTNLIGVITLKDAQPIGSVAFLDYDSTQRKAELRKLIGDPAFRGKGYAKEACELWLDYGLNALGLRKIYLNTLNTHLRNIRLNEELGFKIEGILRNEVFVDGQYHDVLRMGLWRG